MVKGLDHIGIVVNDIQKSLDFYTKKLGLSLYTIEVNDTYQVKIAFLSVGSTLVELLEPISETSKIGKHLKNYGEGLHHIAFETEDLKGALSCLTSKGTPLEDKNPKPGGRGALVAFLSPEAANNVAIELLQKPK